MQQTYYAPAPPPPQTTYAPPLPPPTAPAAAPAPVAYPPRPVHAPHSAGMPSWLIAVLAFAGLGVILGGVYYLRSSGNGKPAASASAALEKPSLPEPGAAAHPYAKFLELGGLRLLEQGSKVQVKFAAINHSAADMAGVAVKGELVASSAQGDDTAVASFEAKIGNLGPYEAKDFTVPATTKLRAYELPDWQFLKARFVITSPK